MTKHLFVLNPAAGTKDRTEKLKEAIQKLKLKDSCDIFVTDGVRAAENEVFRYLEEHKGDFVRIYACGGDGTLSEVVNGVYRSKSNDCAVAVVPIGSGNDFVKSLDIPVQCFLDVKALVEGDLREIDLLVAKDAENNERASLNIISAGFDAAVCKGQEKVKKWPMVSGKTAYNISLVKSVFSKTKHYFVLNVPLLLVQPKAVTKMHWNHSSWTKMLLLTTTLVHLHTTLVQTVTTRSQAIS